MKAHPRRGGGEGKGEKEFLRFYSKLKDASYLSRGKKVREIKGVEGQSRLNVTQWALWGEGGEKSSR